MVCTLPIDNLAITWNKAPGESRPLRLAHAVYMVQSESCNSEFLSNVVKCTEKGMQVCTTGHAQLCFWNQPGSCSLPPLD